MIVKCDHCGARFENALRATTCPHPPIWVDVDGSGEFIKRTDAFYEPGTPTRRTNVAAATAPPPRVKS